MGSVNSLPRSVSMTWNSSRKCDFSSLFLSLRKMYVTVDALFHSRRNSVLLLPYGQLMLPFTRDDLFFRNLFFWDGFSQGNLHPGREFPDNKFIDGFRQPFYQMETVADLRRIRCEAVAADEYVDAPSLDTT